MKLIKQNSVESVPLDYKNSNARFSGNTGSMPFEGKPLGMPPTRASTSSTPFSPTMPDVKEQDEAALVKLDEAALLDQEHREHAVHTARMHQEAHATLKHMFSQAIGDDNILQRFIAFIARDENHWQCFWSRFRPDGTMTWKEFEKYVHWDQKWTGETY